MGGFGLRKSFGKQQRGSCKKSESFVVLLVRCFPLAEFAQRRMGFSTDEWLVLLLGGALFGVLAGCVRRRDRLLVCLGLHLGRLLRLPSLSI